MMPSTSLQPGDIVQCSPASHWAGALVIVTEVRDWGVVGYAPVAPTGVAHVRLAWEHIQKVGRAIWTESRHASD